MPDILSIPDLPVGIGVDECFGFCFRQATSVEIYRLQLSRITMKVEDDIAGILEDIFNISGNLNNHLQVTEGDFVFENSWGNVGGIYETAFARKYGNEVVLGGYVTGGTTGSVIVTLPEGFRPSAAATFCCVGTGVVACRVVVRTDGTVIANFAGSVSMSLRGIRFVV